MTIAERGRSVPKVMDAGFQDALDHAAERHAPGLHVRMPSGAGHDAQVLAERMKSAMLFVPSIGGISHHYAENTKDDDIVLGCQVLADAAAEILAVVMGSRFTAVHGLSPAKPITTCGTANPIDTRLPPAVSSLSATVVPGQ